MRSTRRANLQIGWILALALVALVPSLGSSVPDLDLLLNRAAVPQQTGQKVLVKGDDTIGQLLASLEAPGEPVRLEAARTLGRLGAEAAVEPLRAMLLEGSGAEISVSAEALGRIGSPTAVEALLEPLGDRKLTSRRHAAMGALEQMGETAVDPLLARLDGSDPIARQNVVAMLGWIGSPSATPALEAMLEDANAGVRERAVWALAEIEEAQPGAGR